MRRQQTIELSGIVLANQAAKIYMRFMAFRLPQCAPLHQVSIATALRNVLSLPACSISPSAVFYQVCLLLTHRRVYDVLGMWRALIIWKRFITEKLHD